MKNRTWLSQMTAASAIVAALFSLQAAHAQMATAASPTTHTLTISNATESIDDHGRIVVVAHTDGDLAGVLTLAIVPGPNGALNGGEWALDVSHLVEGEISSDGDRTESLVQLGVIKGTIGTGGALNLDGQLANSLSGLPLSINGATLQFAGTVTGSGFVSESSISDQAGSTGTLTLTF